MVHQDRVIEHAPVILFNDLRFCRVHLLAVLPQVISESSGLPSHVRCKEHGYDIENGLVQFRVKRKRRKKENINMFPFLFSPLFLLHTLPTAPPTTTTQSPLYPLPHPALSFISHIISVFLINIPARPGRVQTTHCLGERRGRRARGRGGTGSQRRGSPEVRREGDGGGEAS